MKEKEMKEKEMKEKEKMDKTKIETKEKSIFTQSMDIIFDLFQVMTHFICCLAVINFFFKISTTKKNRRNTRFVLTKHIVKIFMRDLSMCFALNFLFRDSPICFKHLPILTTPKNVPKFRSISKTKISGVEIFKFVILRFVLP